MGKNPCTVGEAVANKEQTIALATESILLKMLSLILSATSVNPPEDFNVIATLNLNGDYLSDALAAQVGGIGIAPGGNINYKTGLLFLRPLTAQRPNTLTWIKLIPVH